MDRIEQYRIFARVADCASFTRAADMLGLPRSSVSAAVLELEARLGTRLLHRTTRKVALTRDGEAFLARCQGLIAHMEETEGLFRSPSEALAGRVRVDVPGRIGRLILAPALPEFLERHPLLELDLHMSDRAINLVEEGVDCVLRIGALSDSGLIARPVGEVELLNVASPGYLARHGTPASPADLPRHLAVNYASPTTGRVEDWEWIEDGAERTLSMTGRVTVNTAEAYVACCLAGLGLIQVPAYDVGDHLSSGALVEVLPRHRAAPMRATLLYPHRQHLSRRLAAVLDWLDALLKARLRA